MLVLGVTGDVGAGKSTVTSILEEFGAKVINADRITHDIWQRPEILEQAVRKWGREILLPDGKINAPEIAERVFSKQEDYDWLCSLLHPLVRAEMERQLSGLKGFVVAEIPLLFENGVPSWIDLTCYIRTPMQLRLSRNSSRGWTEKEILRREKFLLPGKEKMEKADMVIHNDRGLDDLRKGLKDFSEKMVLLASLRVVEIGSLFPQDIRTVMTTLSHDPEVMGMRTSPASKPRDSQEEEKIPGSLAFLTTEEHYAVIRDVLKDMDLQGNWHVNLTEIKSHAGLMEGLLSDMMRS